MKISIENLQLNLSELKSSFNDKISQYNLINSKIGILFAVHITTMILLKEIYNINIFVILIIIGTAILILISIPFLTMKYERIDAFYIFEDVNILKSSNENVLKVLIKRYKSSIDYLDNKIVLYNQTFVLNSILYVIYLLTVIINCYYNNKNIGG